MLAEYLFYSQLIDSNNKWCLIWRVVVANMRGGGLFY